MINEMNDEYIVAKFADKNNKISSSKFSKKCTDKELFYIRNRYPKEEYVNDLFNLKRIFYGVEKLPICECCGKKIHKLNARWCNQKCQLQDPKFIAWRNCNINKTERVKKFKQTCLKRYGETTPLKNKEIKEKIKQTCLKKYGVKHVIQSLEIREKIKQTCLKKYGVTNGGCSEEALNKIRETNQRRYGVDSSFERKDVSEKCKKTFQDKYGADYFLGTKQYYNCVLKKYGVEYVTKLPAVQEKIKQTCLKKYGVESTSKLPETKIKSKQTCLKKYGVEHAIQSPEILEKINNTKKTNKTFNSSKIEKDLLTYIKNIFPNVITQYKSKAYPFNCDFYIPDLNVYIEYQGSWTHGCHPFDPQNENDMSLLKEWRLKNTKFYDNAIKTWTVRDVNKRNIAYKNKLNFYEFWDDSKLRDFIKTLAEKHE